MTTISIIQENQCDPRATYYPMNGEVWGRDLFGYKRMNRRCGKLETES